MSSAKMRLRTLHLVPAAQLELLDRFQERETITIDRELEQLQRQLDQSSVDLRRVDEEIDDARIRASELSVLQEKLKAFAEVAGPDATRINEAHAAKGLRAREQQVPELMVSALQKLVRELRSSESAFRASVEAQLDSQIRQGANREVFKAIQDDLEALARHVGAAVESVESNARAVEERVRTHASVLAERHATQEAEYRTIIAASEEQGERVAERVALQDALANAQSAANEEMAKQQQRQGAGRIFSTEEEAEDFIARFRRTDFTVTYQPELPYESRISAPPEARSTGTLVSTSR
jgi:hypothetical protein